MKKISIIAGEITLLAELNDTSTARAIWDALPLEARAQTWGEEIYFTIPVTAAQASDAREDVEIGDLGYWPPGHAFCIFFGRTPASAGEQPRAASPVNLVGKVTGDSATLTAVRSGATVRLSRAE